MEEVAGFKRLKPSKFVLAHEDKKPPFLRLQEMGPQNLRTMPSLQARAIGEAKSMRMIARRGVDVKVKSLSLGGGKILRGFLGKTEGRGILLGGDSFEKTFEFQKKE